MQTLLTYIAMYELIGIGAAFLVLGILISRKFDFGAALITAALVLLFIANPSFSAFVWIGEIVIEYNTINLVTVIMLIGFLGYIYRDSGQVERVIEELRNLVPDRRLVIASIPAIFGLMPMPGGALVSAPMIDEEGDELGLNPADKTFINWWFRHIWFSIYPLGLGLIIAALISGVNLYYIVLFNIPIFLTHLAAGFIFGLGRIEKFKEREDAAVSPLNLLYDFSPIILALGLNIILNIPLFLALVAGVILLLIQNKDKYNLAETPTLLKKGLSLKLFLAGLGIVLFQGIIERSEALLPLINILQAHIPLFLVAVIGAFMIGFFIGHLPAGVGLTFSVLFPLLPVVNTLTVATLFLFVFFGYLVSPIHLCIVLTLEYYKADIRDFYKRGIPAILTLAAGIIIWLTVTGAFTLF